MIEVFDSHFHIVDPRFPLVENNGYVPDPFTASDYLRRVASLRVPAADGDPPAAGETTRGFDIRGGAVVSGSFQAFDQAYLINALAELGPSFAGVTQLEPTVTDAELAELHEAGIRAIRFNVVRGGSADLRDLREFAHRVWDLHGWHTELYIDARRIDDELASTLRTLPKVSIDHLGMHEDGIPTLLRLVEAGVKVKADGFGRITMDPQKAIRTVVDTDPTALMAATDLPSTRARRPFEDSDFDLTAEVLTESEAQLVFWQNAADFYLGAGTRP